MSAKTPTSEERKRLLHSFYDLPPKDKEILYRAVGHLRWLTILWDQEKLSPDSMPSIPEKRHILLLLAYKLLQILWFSKLPERDHQTFTVYIRDRLPDDQDPQVVNDIFDTNSDELATPLHWLVLDTRSRYCARSGSCVQWPGSTIHWSISNVVLL